MSGEKKLAIGEISPAFSNQPEQALPSGEHFLPMTREIFRLALHFLSLTFRFYHFNIFGRRLFFDFFFFILSKVSLVFIG